jgi:protein-L-isoaspartate(D-aspartate) O-methyltransferase
MSAAFEKEALPIETRAALALQLRRAGVRNVKVMRAVERVPRELFTPHRFRDLSNRNLALPIECGQTMPASAELGRWLEALGVEPSHRVLEVGSGSGYSAAVLAQLGREILSMERYETLAIEAQSRLASLSISNAQVVFGDGLAREAPLGLFDRIVLHMSFEETPAAALERLAPNGVMVFGKFLPAVAGAKAFSSEADTGSREENATKERNLESRRFELNRRDSRRRARLVRLERAGAGLNEIDHGECRCAAALSGRALTL